MDKTPENSFRLLTGAHMIPMIGKENKRGEDRYYISKCGTCIAVFDGVGGWAKKGVDTSAYSEALSTGAKEAFEKKSLKNPVEILQHAWQSANGITGTSTALAIVINGSKLEAANLGDSQFTIIRNEKTLMQSEEMQIQFNMPYQIGTGSDMSPKTHAKTYSLQLEEGDLIVLGSDGLFDNMTAHAITALIKGKENSLSEIAAIVAQKAHEISLNSRISTPFEKEAQKHKVSWRGGKQDDVTVILGKNIIPRCFIVLKMNRLIHNLLFFSFPTANTSPALLVALMISSFFPVIFGMDIPR